MQYYCGPSRALAFLPHKSTTAGYHSNLGEPGHKNRETSPFDSWASYFFASRSSLETFWSILNGKPPVCWLDLLRLFRRWCASDIHLEDAWFMPLVRRHQHWTSGWVHEETKPDHCKKPMSTSRVWKHWAQRSRDIKSIQLALASNSSGSPKDS